MTRVSLSVLMSAALLALGANDAPAQQVPAAVTGMGEVGVTVKPCALRMSAQLQAEGETAEKALKNLPKLRQAATAKLKALKADPQSIRFGQPVVQAIWGATESYPGAIEGGAIHSDPSVPTVPPVLEPVRPLSPPGDGDLPPPILPPRPVEPPALPRPVMRGPASGAAPAPTFSAPAIAPAAPYGATPTFVPTPGPGAHQGVTVVVAVQADWPLEGETIEDLLAAAEAIKTQLNAVDWFGPLEGDRPVSSPPRPAERESGAGESLLPPRATRSTHDTPGFAPGSPGFEPYMPTSPGMPQFVFVGRLSPQQRKAALAEALQAAKAQAAELAAVAEGKVGPMNRLFGHVRPDLRERLFPALSPGMIRVASTADEATGPTADELRFVASVSAEFGLLALRRPAEKSY